ncbi:MAG: hypothetical protein R3335_08790 [Anaerolineales bacterium]|nr:hypothetical protein [Anaerolineales bacterium]
MTLKRLSPLIILLAALFAVPAAAQSGQIEAALTAPPGEYTVGDPILLNLAVTHPAGYQVIFPELPTEWGDFTVQSQSPLTVVSNPNGTETTTQLIDVRLFSPGEFTTPAIEVAVADPSGNVAQISAPATGVSIASVLVEGDTELRDIKPQAELPYLNIGPWVISSLLLAGAVGAFLFWRRRRRKKATAAAIDRRLPNEVALDELARIFALSLPEQGQYKEYYTLLSDCIRTYIEKVYRIPALERTTGEILTSMSGLTIDPQVSHQLVAFLSRCDLVKFSKFKPELIEAHQALTDARNLVETTWTSSAAAQMTGGEGGPPSSGTLVGPNGTISKMELTA